MDIFYGSRNFLELSKALAKRWSLENSTKSRQEDGETTFIRFFKQTSEISQDMHFLKSSALKRWN